MLDFSPAPGPALRRRTFVKLAGAAASATALTLAGCKKDTVVAGVGFVRGDVGALNFAYALEQLQAAFYQQVINNATNNTAVDFLTNELSYCRAMLVQQNIHRDYFKFLINRDFNGQLINTLSWNFSSVNFNARASVWSTAQTLEEASVAAYNGLVGLLSNPDYQLAAAKIVSVEARHAALTRSLVAPGDPVNFFAGDAQVDPQTGLDRGLLKPSAVVPLVQPFIQQPLDASQLG